MRRGKVLVSVSIVLISFASSSLSRAMELGTMGLQKNQYELCVSDDESDTGAIDGNPDCDCEEVDRFSVCTCCS